MWKMATTVLLGLAALASTGRAAPPDDDPFAFDAAFHGGVPNIDRFGNNNVKEQRGRKLLRLANGDVVVAGLVQAIGATQNQANGSFNLGLVRYAATGQRVAWSSPTLQFAHPDKQYLVYPNTTTAPFRAIADVREHDGRIYVLLERYLSATDTDVVLVVFGVDGYWFKELAVEATSFVASGAGMVFYRNGAGGADKLIVAYTQYDAASVPSVQMKRYTLTSAIPYVQIDVAFGGSGIVDLPVNLCAINFGGAPYTMPCAATAYSVAASYGLGGSSTTGEKPTLYIGGDYYRSVWPITQKDWDLMVMKVDVDGALKTGYGSGGIATVRFDASSGATQDDRARGIVVETRVSGSSIPVLLDYVYVAAAVDKKCHAGIGVAALGPGGQLRSDFGDAGKRVFGGSNGIGLGSLCFAGTYADTPRALARNGNRLAIAGSSTNCVGPLPCLAGAFDDPMLAIVRSSDGALTEWRDHPVRDGGGAYYRGEFQDVVPSADGTFTATGSASDGGNAPIVRLQTVRLRSDRIFGDGFQ